MTTASYVRPGSLVDTAWVGTHGQDAGVRLVEVDVDTTAYATGHIQGAVGWNWQHDLQRDPVRDIPDKAEWEALLGRSGIGNGTRVVLYGDNNNWFAAFAYWLFKLYGHHDVCLMNGGRKKWIDEGRELTQAAPVVTPQRYQAQQPNAALRATRSTIERALTRDGAVMIDVRSPQEFSGELLAPANLPQEGAQRGGHIPGAANVPWSTAVAEDGTFKPATELHGIYSSKGVNFETPAITYCRIGERGAHTWFVLSELLGVPDVRNCDGSWTEWGSLIGAPIAR
jgi:thiosulfate/3-mercaptopyruvate sulfurtransferase